MTDSLHMLDAVLGLPEQLAAAVDDARSVALADALHAGRFDQVVVAGMGGSGIAGDILAAAAADVLSVPVFVVKHLGLPAFVGDRTLVVAMSYSGGTEETVLAAQAALDSGAPLVAVTCGGALGELAQRHDAMLVTCR